MDFVKILGLIVAFAPKVFEATAKKLMKNKEEEKEYSYITSLMLAVCVIYYIAGLQITDNPIFAALRWIQNHWFVAAVYILIAAVLPSVVARKEREKKQFRANKSYASRNCMYNLMGAAAAGAVFGLASGVIKDFGYLKYFYVDDLIPIFACISVWIAIVYQQGERKKDREKKLDHDPSLKFLNQKLNLLHLFNVYFLSIISVVYLVVYTIYCRINHISIAVRLDNFYFWISVVMVFFYALLQHELRYLYVTSLICIPVILISCVYWTTWLTLNREARFLQWIFVLVHFVIYMLSLFAREKLIRIRRYAGSNDTEYMRIRIGKRELALENYFPLVFPVIVGIVYTLIWVMPSFIYRMQANEAYNYIDMICKDTDVDADEVIKRSWEQEMYNEDNETYDIEAFMRFLSRELDVQLLDKGIIDEAGDIPTREVLGEKLKNKPRTVNK